MDKETLAEWREDSTPPDVWHDRRVLALIDALEKAERERDDFRAQNEDIAAEPPSGGEVTADELAWALWGAGTDDCHKIAAAILARYDVRERP